MFLSGTHAHRHQVIRLGVPQGRPICGASKNTSTCEIVGMLALDGVGCGGGRNPKGSSVPPASGREQIKTDNSEKSMLL